MNKIFSKNFISDWSLFDVVWCSVFSLLTIIIGIQSHNSLILILSGLAGMYNVFLCAKGKVINFYFGMFFNFTYGIISLNQHYYASFILYLFYFLPMQFVGVYLWHRNRVRVQKIGIEMKRMKFRTQIVWTIICVISVVVVSFVLKIYSDPMPISDSANNVLAIIGIIMMVKRYAEQWYIWNISNIFGIFLWFPFFSHQSNIYVSQLIMSIAFLVNSIYGMIFWMNHSKKN